MDNYYIIYTLEDDNAKLSEENKIIQDGRTWSVVAVAVVVVFSPSLIGFATPRRFIHSFPSP
jgi:hypothetical protein